MLDEKQMDPQASEVQPEEVTAGAETNNGTESTDVDYAAELESAKAAIVKKEKQLGQAEHVIEELKSKSSFDPSTIEKIVEEKINAVTAQMRSTTLDTLVNQNASSASEAELIKFHLENSIRLSGNDYQDILNAKALANKAKFDQRTSEIKRAQQETEAKAQTTAGQKEETKQAPKLSPEEEKLAKKFGLSTEEILKGYQR